MKIDLNRQEYIALLEILQMADWVLHAYRETDDAPETAKYSRLEQKIFSFANDFN